MSSHRQSIPWEEFQIFGCIKIQETESSIPGGTLLLQVFIWTSKLVHIMSRSDGSVLEKKKLISQILFLNTNMYQSITRYFS